MDIAEKVIDKAVDAIKEIPKEMESHAHVKAGSATQQEKKKIPFSVNLRQETDMQNKNLFLPKQIGWKQKDRCNQNLPYSQVNIPV